MKRTFEKAFCVVLCMMVIVTVTIANATERTEIMPRLTGINAQSASISIDENGRALCGCSVIAKTGYSVEVTMALEQDGSEIKTWTGSGSRVDLAKPYYVTSGHDYQVVVTTRVKTMEGSYLLSYTVESPVDSY